MFGIPNSAGDLVAALSGANAMIEFDLEGKILRANENFLRLMGYALPEIQGRNHTLFVEQNERDSAEYRRF